MAQRVKSNQASTSQDTCECGLSIIAELMDENDEENIRVTIGEVNLIYRAGVNIGFGGFALIHHAYIPAERKCAALKISKRNGSIEAIRREAAILQYVNEAVDDDDRSHIIKLLGYKEMVDTHQREILYLVMEFGGMNLRDYFNERINKVRDEGRIELTKIIRGAAIALEQFHKFGGIHGDVKPENFVVSIYQSLNPNVIDCKLIDFNYSVLTGQGIPDNLKHPIRRAEDISFVLNKAPEIGRDEVTEKADIWAFGVMVYQFMYDDQFQQRF
uniref:Protein kinase domain-containing protein n=1 Tax=Meloidogyne incognita TaxID=6306 RepID=A0A914L1G5_MELIC